METINYKALHNSSFSYLTPLDLLVSPSISLSPMLMPPLLRAPHAYNLYRDSFNLLHGISCIRACCVFPLRLLLRCLVSCLSTYKVFRWLTCVCLDILKHKTHISLSSCRINIFFLSLSPALARAHIFNSTYLHNINMKHREDGLYLWLAFSESNNVYALCSALLSIPYRLLYSFCSDLKID